MVAPKKCFVCHEKSKFQAITLIDNEPLSLQRLKFCFTLPDCLRCKKVTLCAVCTAKFKDYATKSFFFRALDIISTEEATHIRLSKLAIDMAERKKAEMLKKKKKAKLTNRNVKDFECIACGMQFKTSMALQRHRSTCIPIQYLHCKICSNKYRYFSSLNRHVLQEHAGVQKKKYCY